MILPLVHCDISMPQPNETMVDDPLLLLLLSRKQPLKSVPPNIIYHQEQIYWAVRTGRVMLMLMLWRYEIRLPKNATVLIEENWKPWMLLVLVPILWL